MQEQIVECNPFVVVVLLSVSFEGPMNSAIFLDSRVDSEFVDLSGRFVQDREGSASRWRLRVGICFDF